MAEPGTGYVRTKLVLYCSNKDLESLFLENKHKKYQVFSLFSNWTWFWKVPIYLFHISNKLVLFHTFHRPRKKKQ
jgi:hypothetical protein